MSAKVKSCCTMLHTKQDQGYELISEHLPGRHVRSARVAMNIVETLR